VTFDAKPSVVGHRGFGAGQPGGYRENSVESFLAAAASGVPWVELDARRSADGELVLWHDPVTPSGLPIEERTASELAAEGIVALDDVLAALPPHVGVNMDVKTILRDATDPVQHRTHALVADTLRHHIGTRRFFVSSFDPSLPSFLTDSKALIGDVALGLITEQGFPAAHAVSAAANLRLDAVCLHTGTLLGRGSQAELADMRAERILQAAHLAGLEVMTWSPDPEQAVRLAKVGVDAVCVNDIPGVRDALAALRR
jgi:glycerophosphoryl diester phosphodiesterase